jgi:hypothetical protein
MVKTNNESDRIAGRIDVCGGEHRSARILLLRSDGGYHMD